MSKYIPIKLTQLSANESAAVDAINQNLDSIKEHIDDSLSRSAKSPSQMLADLDMNGQKLLNLGAPTKDTDVVRLKDVIENKEEIKTLVNTASVAVEKAMEAAETAESAAEDMADQIQKARDWATKTDGPVEDGEYSSKWYAENIGADVHTVADIAEDVTAVASNAANINTVAGNESNINTVAGISSDVSTVAGNTTDVSAVATNISDVNDCADNMAAIQDAPNQAASAAASATAAQEAALSITGYDLFDHKWSDHLLNDQNWLRADTNSWQDGTVYTEAYQHLADDYANGTDVTETIGSYTITYRLAPDGHKIVFYNQSSVVDNIYNETGVAWYYIYDPNESRSRFKLPRENPAREELIQVVRAKGNGIALGVTDGPNNYGVIAASGSGLSGRTGAYGENVGGTGGKENVDLKVFGLTTDSTKSGIISSMTESISVYKGKQYLYFYVGQFSQTATEQTAGLNSELFNGKVDLDAANLSDAGKIAISSLGMPSKTKIETLTLLASGQSYTAPANGYFNLGGTYNSNGRVHMYNNTSTVESAVYYTSGTYIAVNVPVQKGDSVTIWYDGTHSYGTFRFIYAKGSESEAS